jgi:hypothetical protein
MPLPVFLAQVRPGVDSCISFYFGQKNFDQKLLAGKISAKKFSTEMKIGFLYLSFWPKILKKNTQESNFHFGRKF